MINLMTAATWGLAYMALYGGTSFLHNEQCIGATPACVTSGAVQTKLNQDAEDANLLITCPNGRKEHLAPSAIRLSDGTEVAMVEPIWAGFCYDDHFIIRHPDGTLERWDVGYTERIVAYGRGRPPQDRSIQAIPRQIMDFAKLRNGDDEGGGVGSLLQTAMTPPQAPSGETTDTSTTSTGGSSSNTGVIVGGVVAAGAVIYFATGGAFSDLSFTPHYSFYHNDGRNSYYYGARWDYHKDNTSAYWFTGQNGSNEVLDNWRYGSGASWTNGVWKAAYNGIGDSETMDADMSLSLIKNSGVWTLKTGLGAFAHIDEVNNTDMNYFLRAQADAQYQHWTLSQAAYYNGDSGQFNLDFVRNLEK